MKEPDDLDTARGIVKGLGVCFLFALFLALVLAFAKARAEETQDLEIECDVTVPVYADKFHIDILTRRISDGHLDRRRLDLEFTDLQQVNTYRLEASSSIEFIYLVIAAGGTVQTLSNAIAPVPKRVCVQRVVNEKGERVWKT